MRRYLIVFVLMLLVACSGQTKEELLQEGNRLRDQGNFRGAVVLYKNALEKDANFIEARIELADAYLNAGSLERAEKEFQKVLHQKPSEADVLLKLATVFIQQRQPEKALLELDKYHSANAETAESAVIYGLAHGAAGDLESAESFFTKALHLDDQSLQARLNLAKVCLQRKDYEKSRTFLRALLTIDSKNIPAYYLMANVENRAGQREEALKVYQKLLAVDAKQLEALYMSGIFQMDLGDLEATRLTVDKIVSTFPNQPAALRLEGMLSYRQGNYDDAVLSLQTALKTEQHPLSYFFLGLSHYSLEQYELALSQFQKALDISAGFERARVLVAMTLLKQKRLDDAVIEIRRVLTANPGNAYARNILGSAYLAKGQYDEGMEELEAATELDPSLADAHLKRGLFRLAKGDGEQGEADLIKAIDAAPEVLNSRLMLVTHYLRQKNYSAAIQILQEGMNGSPVDALLNNYLAAAYFSQKKPEAAIKALNAAKQANADYLTPYFNLASYYASQAEYEKAVAEYQRILGRQADNLKALLGIASLHSVQGDDDKVEQVFQQIEATGTEQAFIATARYKLKRRDLGGALAIVDRGLQKHNASVTLYDLKGALQLRLQQQAEAEATFTQLSGLSPERGNSQLIALYLATKQTEKAEKLSADVLKSSAEDDYAYLLSAAVLLQKKDVKGAAAILQQGIEKVKNPLRLQMRLGQIFERTNRLQQAEQIYQRVIEKAPRFAGAYASLATIKERSGDKGAALQLYRATLRYDRRNTLALNNLAYLLADNFGEPKEALNYALSAYRLQPGDPRIMDTLGYVLIKAERAEDAAILLEKAHQLLPEVQTVALHLAMAKAQSGQSAAAKELLQQVIEKGTEAEIAQAQDVLKSL